MRQPFSANANEAIVVKTDAKVVYEYTVYCDFCDRKSNLIIIT